ncbi:MAG TPA: phosphotransferase [Nitrospiraceae bacterium]|jgi:aminoglycoside phosphotransferase (APT) family kinase protein
MPNRPHGPVQLDGTIRRGILTEIQDRLSDLAPAGLAVHGDFAPWNVRQFADGRVAVVDWEELTYGVPVADDLWFVVAVHASRGSDAASVLREVMQGSSYTRAEVSNAAEYWLKRLSEPEAREITSEVEMPTSLDENSRRIRTLLETVS